MNRSYQDLIAWQKAMDLVVAIYSASKEFPREEMYGLTSQLRRAAVSVPSNLAEGQGRRSKRDFAQFVRIARGSLMELETQVQIASRLGYLESLETKELLARTDEVSRLTQGLLTALAEGNLKAKS